VTDDERTANEKAAKNMINLNTDDELTLRQTRAGWTVKRKNGEVLGTAPELDDAIVAALAGPSRVAKKHRWALGQALSLALDAEGVVALYSDDEDEDEEDNDDEDGDPDDDDLDDDVTVRRD
jgi:hypothetical protein